jgi:hypothetical protein
LGYQGQGAESSEGNHTKESRRRTDADPRVNAYESIYTEGTAVRDRPNSKVASFITFDIILNNI